MMKLMRNIMFLSMVGAQNDFNTKYLDFCLNNQHNSQTVINLRFRNDPMGAAICSPVGTAARLSFRACVLPSVLWAVGSTSMVAAALYGAI